MFNWLSLSGAAIKATELPMLAASFDGSPPRLKTSSQLGGLPWWPANLIYPVDREGRPLMLLAQISFDEAPKLAPFPEKGLLQIFIGRDDLYGCTFCDDNGGDEFACVLHEDTSLPAAALIDPAFDPSSNYSPLESPLEPIALRFNLSRMPVDPTDYRLNKLLPKIFNDENKREAYHNARETPAIRLGGYPSFTQEDPRSYREPGAIGDFNLLTIDTTDGIMWGDSGVDQFFMHEDDLRRRDFSRVRYNWDCC